MKAGAAGLFVWFASRSTRPTPLPAAHALSPLCRGAGRKGAPPRRATSPLRQAPVPAGRASDRQGKEVTCPAGMGLAPSLDAAPPSMRRASQSPPPAHLRCAKCRCHAPCSRALFIGALARHAPALDFSFAGNYFEKRKGRSVSPLRPVVGHIPRDWDIADLRPGKSVTSYRGNRVVRDSTYESPQPRERRPQKRPARPGGSVSWGNLLSENGPAFLLPQNYLAIQSGHMTAAFCAP